jgi:NAD(P)-dependent dehydrogenase (short-subunit alcohol dehydrogenase family)
MQTQTAWVTGGGTGIGRGIAEALASDGFRVYISGRRDDVLNEVASSWSGSGELIPAQADVTSDSDLERVVEQIRSEDGRIDVLVLCAGINVAHRSVEDTTPEEWRKIVDVNATGAFLSLKKALPLIPRGDEGGLVVNISSIAGLRTLRMAGVAYSASKFASQALGVFAGNELAEQGIRVTNIYPGEVNTPILDQRPVPPPAEKRAQMVQPGEIGQLVSLIARFPTTTHVSELVIKPRYQELV